MIFRFAALETTIKILLAAMMWGVLANGLQAIEFFKSIEAAQESVDKPLPMVVSFGAPWCGWCRRMEADTFGHESVVAIEKQYLWVKLNVDNEPELSARFQVRGVPHTVVLNDQGRVMGMRSGYMNSEVFLKFVKDSFENPLPIDLTDELLEKLATDDGDDYDETVTQLVEILGSPDRTQRKRIVQALLDEGEKVQPLLLELMENDRLSVRAAAAYTLAFISKIELPFQPFESAARRAGQLEAWRKALETS